MKQVVLPPVKPRVLSSGAYDPTAFKQYVAEARNRGFGDAEIAVQLKVLLHRLVYFENVGVSLAMKRTKRDATH